MTFQTLLKTEHRFIQLFSTSLKTPYGVQFFDAIHPTKHMHNFYYVTSLLPSEIVSHYEDFMAPYDFTSFQTMDLTYLSGLSVPPYEQSEFGFFYAKIHQLNISTASTHLIQNVDASFDHDFFQFVYEDDLQFGQNYANNNPKRLKTILLNHSDQYEYYILKLDSKIIGHISVFYDETLAKIDEFYVLEDYQKKGYGSQLMAHAIASIQARGIFDVYLITDLSDTAQSLYLKYGFNYIGTIFEMKKT